MNNVYYVGSGEFTFDLIERITSFRVETRGAFLPRAGKYRTARHLPVPILFPSGVVTTRILSVSEHGTGRLPT